MVAQVRSVQDLYERFRHLIHELAKFGVIGGVGFIVTLVGADLLRFDAGLGKYKAVTVATVVATLVTFFGNRYWTFRHRERTGTGRESVLFFVMNGVGLLIQYASIFAFQDLAGLNGKLWYNLANFVGIVFGTIFRFWSYRRFVWRESIVEVLEEEHEAEEHEHEVLEPTAAAGAPAPGTADGVRVDEAGRIR
jgi:putative flippase GtrA